MREFFTSFHEPKSVARSFQKKAPNRRNQVRAKACCWMDAVSHASILVAALIDCNAAASSLELLCEGLKRGGSDRAFKELLKSLRIFDDVQCLADSFGARPVHDFQVALYSRAEGA